MREEAVEATMVAEEATKMESQWTVLTHKNTKNKFRESSQNSHTSQARSRLELEAKSKRKATILNQLLR